MNFPNGVQGQSPWKLELSDSLCKQERQALGIIKTLTLDFKIKTIKIYLKKKYPVTKLAWSKFPEISHPCITVAKEKLVHFGGLARYVKYVQSVKVNWLAFSLFHRARK